MRAGVRWRRAAVTAALVVIGPWRAGAQTAPVTPPPEPAPPLTPAAPVAPAPPAANDPPPATFAPPPPGYYPPPPAYYPPPPVYYPPPPVYAQPPAPEATLTQVAPPALSGRRPAEDPQADRAVLLPTAYTHPRGTVFVSDYEVALVQVGYALTDDTQVSLTTVPPLGAERVAFLDVTLKSALVKSGPVRVAALGSASGVVAKEIGLLFVGRAGAVAQLCLEARCDSSFSISSNLTLAGVMLMANGVGGIFRLGRIVSFLAEFDSLVPVGRQAAEFNGSLVGGGVRFHWVNWGLDLSLVRTLRSDATTFPFLALTYRSRA